MRIVTPLVLWAAALPASLGAQSVSAGALFQSYALAESENLRIESLQLLTLPVGGRVQLRPWLDVSLSGAWADGRATLANGASSEVSGLVDTRVSVELSRERVFASLSALLPTGDVVGTVSEVTLVGLLSTDLLPFAITQWGAGGGYAGDVGVTLHAPSASVQVAVGGSILSDSRPLGTAFEYQPGTQLRARSRVEAAVGEAGLLGVLVGYQHFAVDTHDGRNVFRPGGRVESMLSYAFPLGSRRSMMAYGGFYRLGGGFVDDGALAIEAAPMFPGLDDQPARSLFRVGAEMRLAQGRHDLVPRGELRVLRREGGIGQGWLASVGGRASVRLQGGDFGRRLLVEPTFALSLGSLVAAQGIESRVLGLEVGATLRWEGGR